MTLATAQAGIAAVLIVFAASELATIAARGGAGAGHLRLIGVAARRIAPALTSPDRLRSRAARAGLLERADDLYCLKAGAALAAALLTLPLVVLTGVRPGIVLIGVFAGAAFVLPDLLLEQRIARRRAQIAQELPAVVDLVAVSVGAGAPVASALEQVATRHGGTLGAELLSVQQAIAAGSPRSEALRALAQRCPHEGVAALVAAIDRSDRHGTQLTAALAAIAVDARRNRARAIHERASRAAPQIQLVIALGLVPATVLIVAAALVASY